MKSSKIESKKPETQTSPSFVTSGSGVSQQRTRGSKFLFQELFRKKEENQLKDIDKETSESELVTASLQANKVLNYEGAKGGSPKYGTAPSNIDRTSLKDLALIKSRNGQVKIRPPISANDISFDVTKTGIRNEKENFKRKNFLKEQEKIYKGRKRKSANTSKGIKESKDLKGKNKSTKFKLKTFVLQDSNSSNSSIEISDDIVNKTNDAYMLDDEFSATGSTTQEIFQNKEYKGKGSPKSNQPKGHGNDKESEDLGNNNPRLNIFTASSSPETVEISSESAIESEESDNESDKCNTNRKKRKVLIEETVIQPKILAEDSFQINKIDNTSDSFDYVHEKVMTQLLNKDESPVIGIGRKKRKTNLVDEKSGTSKKAKKTLLMKKVEEELCIPTELSGEKYQEMQIVKSNPAGQAKKISRINHTEKEITSNECQNVCESDNSRSQTKITPKKSIDREVRSDLVMTPESGSRHIFHEISPCSDAGTSPFMLSQPSQVIQTPRSKTIFTKLSLSQKRNPSNSQQSSNSESDSTPHRILKSNMKAHLSKLTSATSILESIGSEHMLERGIHTDINVSVKESDKNQNQMRNDSIALESSYSIVESPSSLTANAKDVSTYKKLQTVGAGAADPRTTPVSCDIFDPVFTSTQHHNAIQRKGSCIHIEEKSVIESDIEIANNASKSNNSIAPEVITIKSSSDSSSNNSISSSLKQVSPEKANNSEESTTSYASSDSTEMLKPVGRSCLSGITMVLEQFFGGTMEECLKVLQKNSFNILTTLQELQELYPDAAEFFNEDTINDTQNQ